MRYAQIRKMDISNGEGVGVALFTQGCHFHCEGCHNPEQWSFNGGYEYTQKTQEQILKLLSPSYITRFSILGGEPLEDRNLYHLACLIAAINNKYDNSKKIWLYTGWEYDELLRRIEKSKNKYLNFILEHVDVLIDGRFIQEEKDITLQWRGSRNQKVYDKNYIRANLKN